MKKISIVVTCYNIEKHIKKCLKSIANQTIQEFEVLVVDDGSTDKSGRIIQDFIRNDKRFKYLKKKNGGVSSARNYGLAKVKCEYICFIDGDDYLDKKYLEVLLNAIESGDYDFSICNIKRIYKDKTTHNAIDDQIVKECRYPALWNKMCKKSLFTKYNLKFVENVWYEDLAMGVEIYLASNNYITTNAYVYNYIQHEKSLVKVNDNRIFDIYKIMEEIEKFAKTNNFYTEKFITIEFINVYHVLVGTIYRASFHNQFSMKMIKEIYDYVKQKYPTWYKNEYIKNLPFFFKVYLKCLKYHFFWLIFIMLKLFNKKINL